MLHGESQIRVIFDAMRWSYDRPVIPNMRKCDQLSIVDVFFELLALSVEGISLGQMLSDRKTAGG
jgi:hypothetical protein